MGHIVSIHKRVAGSPAELLVMTAMAETVAAGHLFGLHVTPDNEIIIASEDDKPAAFIVFEEYEDIGEFWVVFGYCRPEYRRHGHYRGCIKKLRDIAKARGYAKIHTAVHPDNAAAKASIEARGGKILYLGYTFPVKGDSDEDRRAPL